MPKTSNAFALPVPPDVAMEITRRLCVERGWPMRHVTESELVAAVPFKTKNASVVLTLLLAGDETSVRMEGHISGVGPVLKRMLQEKLDSLQSSLVYESARALPGGLSGGAGR